LQIEAKWGAVIAHWLREDTDWLAAHSLPRCVSAGRQHCVDQRAIAAQLGGKGLARASRIACAPASA
jgi:hypothetical protein